MKILLLILIICILVLIFYLVKNSKFNLLISILLSLLVIYFILYPKVCIESSLKGARLFFNSVFPTLFPFLIITSLLMEYDGINIYSNTIGKFICTPLGLSKNSSFALIISALCGYPLGGKYSCELYEKKLIDSYEFKKLINVASNTSPLFLIGAVATTMLNNSNSGYILLISNYLSCIIMAFLLPRINTKDYYISNSKNHVPNLGVALKNSVDTSLKTCFNVGSFIIIFSVVLAIIKNNVIYNIVLSKISNTFYIEKDLLSGVILGLVEITNGCYYLSMSSLDFKIKLSLVSFLCSFSGLCIIAQVHSFAYKFKEFSLYTYIFRKFIQGIISFIITFIICSKFESIYTSYSNITVPYFPYIIILLVLPLMLFSLKRLFDIS